MLAALLIAAASASLAQEPGETDEGAGALVLPELEAQTQQPGGGDDEGLVPP